MPHMLKCYEEIIRPGTLGKVYHARIWWNYWGYPNRAFKPDVDPKTHPYIATGLKENKFGIAYADALSLYERACALPNLRIEGIDCHIGSQLTELAPIAVQTVAAQSRNVDVTVAAQGTLTAAQGASSGVSR